MSDDHGPPGEAPQAHPRAEWSREPFVPVAAGNPDALRYAAVWGGVGVLVGVVVSTMRARRPRRRPMTAISSARCALPAGWSHAATSSPQRRWHCGPRRRSGFSAE